MPSMKSMPNAAGWDGRALHDAIAVTARELHAAQSR